MQMPSMDDLFTVLLQDTDAPARCFAVPQLRLVITAETTFFALPKGSGMNRGKSNVLSESSLEKSAHFPKHHSVIDIHQTIHGSHPYVPGDISNTRHS